MTRRGKQVVLGAAALAVVAAAAPHPRADLTVLAHAPGDPAPRRFEFAFDAGLLAMKVLVTWTAAGLSR